MSRATKAYASQYQTDRVHASKMFKGEARTYEADFNGALNGETIVSAQWSLNILGTLTLSGVTQVAGVVSVKAVASQFGYVGMQCTATTNAGRTLAQLFDVTVHGPLPVATTALSWP